MSFHSNYLSVLNHGMKATRGTTYLDFSAKKENVEDATANALLTWSQAPPKASGEVRQ